MGTVTSVGSGNYNTGGTWDSGSRPGSSDDVVIANGHTVTLVQGENANSLEVQSGGILDGNTETLTVDGENGNGYAVDIDGEISGTDTDITITTAATTAVDFNPTAGAVRHLTIDNGGNTITLTDAMTLSGNLTITAGELDTASDRALTVNGTTTVGSGGAADAATLTCNASAITLGSGITGDNIGLTVNQGGTVAGGSGVHILGSLHMVDHVDAKMTATTHASGTTINSEATSGSLSNYNFVIYDSATFDNADGTVIFTGPTSQMYIQSSASIQSGQPRLHNLTINSSGNTFTLGNNLTVEGTLTITAGTLTTSGSNNALTVAGELKIDGGTLTCNDSDVIVRNIYMDGGTLSAPSNSSTNGLEVTGEGTTGGGGDYSIRIESGTITHNNGTLALSADSNTFMRLGNGWHDFIIRNDGSSTTRTHEFINPTTINGDFTLTNGSLQSYNTSWGISVTGNVLITKGQLGRSSAAYDSSFGSLTIAADGTYIATSGTTTITSMTSTGSGDRSLSLVSGGTFTNNSGTVLFNSGADQRLQMAGTGNLYNLTVNKSDNEFITFGNLTILNNLDVTLAADHTWRPNAGSDTLTVYGNTYLTTGKIGNTTQYTGTNNWGNVTINSGEFILSTGTNNVSGIRNVGGTVSQS